MLLTGLVLSFTAVAAWTDLRERKIYNWNTYTGILTAFVFNALCPGGIGWEDAGAGFLGCGLILVACFLFFPVSGGDVKLIAMLGAWLGWQEGLATLLWTCVLGAVLALVRLVWNFGTWRLVQRSGQQIWSLLYLRQPCPWTDEERQLLKTELSLGPAALLAVGLVRILEWK